MSQIGRNLTDGLGESRDVAVTGGMFRDRFSDYEVHIYKLVFEDTALAQVVPVLSGRGSGQTAYRLDYWMCIQLSGALLSDQGPDPTGYAYPPARAQ